jgi:tetratricopeptide (TPR) repeat protein
MTAVLSTDVRHLVVRAVSAEAVAYPAGPAVTLPPFASAGSARAWLDAELPALLALAGNRTLGLRAGPAPALLGVALLRLGRYDEAVGVLTRGARSCRAAGDRHGEAAAMVNLAICRDRQGRWIEALAWHTEAYELCLRIGWRAGAAVARRGVDTVLV